jgi:hypothetical protein
MRGGDRLSPDLDRCYPRYLTLRVYYNKDPGYLSDLLLYKLTIEAQERVEVSPLSRREIIKRLGTSTAQFNRLLDQTNYGKSVDQLLSLLHVLDCDVELTT